MDPKLLQGFRAASNRAEALRSVGRSDDEIVDSILKLDSLPQEVKNTFKQAKVSGKASQAIKDLSELPVQTQVGFDDASYQKEGTTGKVARFLGIEKAGRRIGSAAAKVFDPSFEKNLDVASKSGVLSTDERRKLETGNVNNREFVGSLGNVALNVALPAAGKYLSSGGNLARVAKAGAVGGAFGTAGGLNENKSGGDLATSAAVGAVLGAGTAALVIGGKNTLDAFAKHRKELAGINPQTENILKELPNPDKFNKYIESAKKRSVNIRQNSPIGEAALELEKAGDDITKQLRSAGKAVGDAKKAAAGVKVSGGFDDAITSFQTDIANKFGLQVKVKNGAVSVSKIPGGARTVLAGDRARVSKAFKDLMLLQKKGDVRKAADVIANLDDLVDYKNADQFGVIRDPLEGLLKQTRGKINAVVRDASPSLADANDAFSALKDAEGWIASTAGKDLGRGELLLRRVFSGDKSREALGVLDVIKKYTGKDLVQDAVLARLAIEQFGDVSQKTLLQQALNIAQDGVKGNLLSGAINATGRFLMNPNTEKIANKILGNPTTGQQVLGGATEAARRLEPVAREVGYNTIGRTLGGL